LSVELLSIFSAGPAGAFAGAASAGVALPGLVTLAGAAFLFLTLKHPKTSDLFLVLYPDGSALKANVSLIGISFASFS
jgi:hypothetical protein